MTLWNRASHTWSCNLVYGQYHVMFIFCHACIFYFAKPAFKVISFSCQITQWAFKWLKVLSLLCWQLRGTNSKTSVMVLMYRGRVFKNTLYFCSCIFKLTNNVWWSRNCCIAPWIGFCIFNSLLLFLKFCQLQFSFHAFKYIKPFRILQMFIWQCKLVTKIHKPTTANILESSKNFYLKHSFLQVVYEYNLHMIHRDNSN